MRPVKIIIEGGFWDSQIYSGVLMLFTDNGSIQRVDWRSQVNTIADENADLQTALRVAFVDGDLFYNEKVRKILKDPAIDQVIRSQLAELSARDLAVAVGSSGSAFEVKSPFDFYPADTDIYYATIIAAGESGLYSCRSSKLHAPTAKPKSVRHHDASFLQVKASARYTAVAAAAGNDGLFEFGFEPEDRSATLTNETKLSPRPCKACEWSFESVLGWSESSAFLAKFKEEKYQREKIRLFERVIDVNEIFKEAGNGSDARHGVSWGAREKLYRFGEDGITVVDLSHKERRKKDVGDDGGAARLRGVIKASISQDEVIATGTASFGTVIELPDRVTVLRSDGHVDEFAGEPVHWRIFPRSDLYSNQLHLIYEDRIEIVSFVHDYFVDQAEKMLGFYRGGGSEIRTDTFL
jgi:hypothetical protein